MVAKSPLLKTLWAQWDRLKVENDVIYRRWYSSDGFHECWQMLIPAEVQSQIMTLVHKGMRGHFGEARTKYQLQSRAYWPGWARDVENFCSNCDECARFRQGKPTRQGLMQSMQVGEPMERISVNLTATSKVFKWLCIHFDSSRWILKMGGKLPHSK